MNVLLLMTDQQRWDALGAVNPELTTPNLDRLAAEGLRCTNAFTSSPECVPARATLLTGQPAWEHGVTGNDRRLRPGSWTFVRALREHGWATWGVGKHHFRPPRADHGYERLEVAEGQPGADDDFAEFLRSVGWGWLPEPNGVRHELYYLPQVSPLPDELHATTWTADRAVAALAASARRGGPFYGVVSFLKPHPPFDPTLPYAGMYDPDSLAPPAPETEALPPFPIEVAQNHSKWREETGAPLSRALRAYYFACVTQVDAAIGRVLGALDDLGLADDTLVVFTSDHGELLGDHGLWGKRSYLDGSARVPLVLRWPGTLSPGSIHAGLALHEDLAPTVLAAAGIGPTVASRCHGLDLVGAARGAERGRELFVGQLYEGALAVVGVVTRRWRWSYSVAGGVERLTDGDADHHEATDRSADGDVAEVVGRLRAAAVAALSRHPGAPVVEDGALVSAPESAVHDAFGRNLQGLPPGGRGPAFR